MPASILIVKKGARVRLANGWWATVMDNTVRQHTRVCDVEGFHREMGSVYSTDIEWVEIDGRLELVYHTPAQLKAKLARRKFGL